MESYTLLYKIKATDEFFRYFEANAKIDANYLIIKDQADPIYLQIMIQLVSSMLWRMGTDVSAEWSVEVGEEL